MISHRAITHTPTTQRSDPIRGLQPHRAKKGRAEPRLRDWCRRAASCSSAWGARRAGLPRFRDPAEASAHFRTAGWHSRRRTFSQRGAAVGKLVGDGIGAVQRKRPFAFVAAGKRDAHDVGVLERFDEASHVGELQFDHAPVQRQPLRNALDRRFGIGLNGPAGIKAAKDFAKDCGCTFLFDADKKFALVARLPSARTHDARRSVYGIRGLREALVIQAKCAGLPCRQRPSSKRAFFDAQHCRAPGVLDLQPVSSSGRIDRYSSFRLASLRRGQPPCRENVVSYRRATSRVMAKKTGKPDSSGTTHSKCSLFHSGKR